MITNARGVTIGQLAKLTGVNLETVRYYERIGLMVAPDRNASGHRLYDQRALRQLTFVRRSRELGFSVADIRELIRLATPDTDSCAEVQKVAAAHLAGVRTKLADLARLEVILNSTIAQCNESVAPACPVLDMLGYDFR